MEPPRGDDPTVTPDVTLPASDSQPPIPSLPGYQLGALIGRGGMGEVVTAFDQHIEREVAIKRLRASAPSTEAIARFVREAKVQARLDHPAIVPVHELGTDDAGNPYFTMKRLTGRTLAEQLTRGATSIQPLLRAFVDVCFAIELAHSRGIVHRDLKPSNIMLGDFDEVYVIDWGVARILRTRRTSSMMSVADSLNPEETAVGAVLGTPGYMAPEQLKGDDVGPAADVFSLGAILFEILAGEPLHPAGKAAIASTLSKCGDSPAGRAPARHVAPELDAVCVAALAEATDTRPSARELATRIQRYLDGDRDLERRKALAADQLATARAALTDPARQREAAQAASRALALDPESRDAAAVVTKLVLDPPDQIPPALERELADIEADLNRQRSRSAMKAFLSLFLFLPIFVFLQNVASYFDLVALYAAATGMAILSWHNSKTGRTPGWLLMLGNFALALMFTRLAGTFVLSAALVCGQALALATRSNIARRPAALYAWIVVTMVAPLALEWFGVFAPTWKMTGGGIITKGTIIDTVRDADVLALAAGQVALAVVVGAFALSITRAREAAQRKAHIQAWHLQQLVPTAKSP